VIKSPYTTYLAQILAFVALAISAPSIAQDNPPTNEPSYANDGEDPDPPAEANETPDDEGIEYAEELTDEELTREQEKAEAAERAEDERRRQKAIKPPSDEPMPLIRRQRETVVLPKDAPVKRIKHPNAAKGLTKITRDKVYIYKIKKSDQTKASSFKIGMFSPNELENKETGVSFEDFYETNNVGILFDYEWQLFQKFGKLGLKVGSGIAMAQGTGVFKNENGTTGAFEPKEKLTFIIMPNTVGAITRLQFWEKQILVPYGEGGGTIFTFAETRDDGKNPKFGAAFGAYFAVGAAFSLAFLDDISMIELDRDYSINNVYFTAEYRFYQGFGDFNFTGELINGGVTVEF
jgi:hypothetical protein